jgi:hypothetical protein
MLSKNQPAVADNKCWPGHSTPWPAHAPCRRRCEMSAFRHLTGLRHQRSMSQPVAHPGRRRRRSDSGSYRGVQQKCSWAPMPCRWHYSPVPCGLRPRDGRTGFDAANAQREDDPRDHPTTRTRSRSRGVVLPRLSRIHVGRRADICCADGSPQTLRMIRVSSSGVLSMG